eukprot:COSAG02_NODE_2024_length_10084_cov_130.539509_11_plen_128_part_00
MDSKRTLEYPVDLRYQYCTGTVPQPVLIKKYVLVQVLVNELCVLRTFGGVDFSLGFICVQSVPEFLWDRLRASIQFPVMPKRAQYARFSGEYCESSRQEVSKTSDARVVTHNNRPCHAGTILFILVP